MIFDVIVLVCLLVSAVVAFLRGFIREVLTILGVVGGLTASYVGGPLLSPLINSWFGNAEDSEPQKFFDLIPYTALADALAYGSIFITVVIVLSIISHFLAGWAKAIGLGAVDRILGVIFGILRGIVILALLYLPVPILFDQQTRDQWFSRSKTHFYVAATSGWMTKFLPEILQEDVEKKTAVAKEPVKSVIKATREKLQEIDVLQMAAPKAVPPPKAAPLKAKGYQKEQRQNLNQLFEDNLDE